MYLRVERRAEVALRSLERREQSRVARVLNDLLVSDRASLRYSPKLQMLKKGRSGKQLFAQAVGPRLRLVLSFENDTCVVEDIMTHDRLERLIRRERQE